MMVHLSPLLTSSNPSIPRDIHGLSDDKGGEDSNSRDDRNGWNVQKNGDEWESQGGRDKQSLGNWYGTQGKRNQPSGQDEQGGQNGQVEWDRSKWRNKQDGQHGQDGGHSTTSLNGQDGREESATKDGNNSSNGGQKPSSSESGQQGRQSGHPSDSTPNVVQVTGSGGITIFLSTTTASTSFLTKSGTYVSSANISTPNSSLTATATTSFASTNSGTPISNASIPTASSDSSASSLNIGVLVGGVIGGMAFLVLLAVFGFLCYRRRRRHLAPSMAHLSGKGWHKISEPVDGPHRPPPPGPEHSPFDYVAQGGAERANVDIDMEAALQRKVEILENSRFEAAVRNGVKG